MVNHWILRNFPSIFYMLITNYYYFSTQIHVKRRKFRSKILEVLCLLVKSVILRKREAHYIILQWWMTIFNVTHAEPNHIHTEFHHIKVSILVKYIIRTPELNLLDESSTWMDDLLRSLCIARILYRGGK